MDAQSLLIGGCSLVSGVVMLVRPGRSRRAAQAKTDARKAQLAAGAPERFFEERRTLDAYPPAPTDQRWRLKGAFFTVAGIVLLMLALYR